MNGKLAAVREYHEATKHRKRCYAPSPGFLDWDAQPNPFRRFSGAPLIPLPLVDGSEKCTYDDLYTPATRRPDTCDIDALGLFFELAFGLSAWKTNGFVRWSLRNTPSSGNLHPTEAYLLLWQSDDDTGLEPGLYHYAPYEHALERRARLPHEAARNIALSAPDTFAAIGLTSIIWREEWKYGARAYRYCQHDVGHALAAAQYSASLNGWHLALEASASDDQTAACLGLNRHNDFRDAENEHPDLMAVLASKAVTSTPSWTAIADALVDWTGNADRLSAETVAWPQIAKVLPAVYKPPHHKTEPGGMPAQSQPGPVRQFAQTCSIGASHIIRRRRSAQRMDGQTGISQLNFERLLTRTLPSNGQLPFNGFPYPPAINLLVFVHAVNGLDPGLYLLNRNPDRWEAFLENCLEEVQPLSTLSDTKLALYTLGSPTSVRKTASQISCYQGLGGRGAFSLAMIADFRNVLETEGPWAYRRLHWEAGLIGQVLYLEAEASGLQGTGIGCFFDDEVLKLMNGRSPEQGAWQSLYHFAVGAGLNDGRVMTEPAYAHLSDRSPMQQVKS